MSFYFDPICVFIRVNYFTSVGKFTYTACWYLKLGGYGPVVVSKFWAFVVIIFA